MRYRDLAAALFAAALSLSCAEPTAPVPATPEATGAPPAPTAAPVASAAPAAHAAWSYAGDGPDHWSEQSDAAACKGGATQSPIDLDPHAPKGAGLAPLVMQYAKGPLAERNNGHMIEAEGTPGSTLQIQGVPYSLVQLHLHAPSEHTVGGKRYDAELHLVHKAADGSRAVVGVLLATGKESAALAPFFDHLARTPSDAAAPVAGATLDVGSMFKPRAKYWSYPGSLTTPPCSEGIRWFVLGDPQEISAAQLSKLRDALHGDTARPTQKLQGRSVVQFTP